MAEEKKPAAGEAAGGKKKNSKRVIIVIAALVLLLSGGAAAFFLTRAPAEDAAKGDAGKGAKDVKSDKDGKDKKAENKKPYFVDSEMFTVNLKDPEKFLQIKLTFQVGTPEDAEQIKDLMPKVRSSVIPVLSAQDPAELMSAEGKDKLCVLLAQAANKSLAGDGPGDAVQAVLITHMIIQ